MTNEDILNDMLRKTFPNVIFCRSINEGNKKRAIHFSEEWLNEEYKEPRSGHWIDTGSESFEFHRVYKCSECGNTEIEYPERICGHFRYCPNCGVKMEDKE